MVQNAQTAERTGYRGIILAQLGLSDLQAVLEEGLRFGILAHSAVKSP
jgi:hypothetical protein